MSLVKKLSLPSELVYKKKPCNNKHSDKHLFKIIITIFIQIF